MRSLAYLETPFISGMSSVYFMALITLSTSLSLSPSKGSTADSKVYKITPKDQISHRSS